MGGDGGSIPGRDVLVKTKKAAQQATKQDRYLAIWYHCALSQVPLKNPIVVCGLGKFYNKETVIEKLLDNEKYPSEEFNHLKRLTDVKDINLRNCDNFKNYTCPITGLEMSGRFPFIFIWSCGCIISKKAFDEIPGNNCLNCEKKFTVDDIVHLNPSEDEFIEYNKSKMETRRLSKIKKRKHDINDQSKGKKKRIETEVER